MVAPGMRIDKKYEVMALIARGGMSRVWLVRDLRLNKLWAAKEVGRDLDDPVASERIVAEASLMRKLDHPALPRIVDICAADGSTLIVMDYIEGRSLKQVLDEQGAQAEDDVAAWGAQLCDALSYLHAQSPPIVYRDMKPGNVVLREDGTVRLIDFGIAREYKAGALSDTCVLGTRGYAAPEQLVAGAQTDARTDVYSLGATLYALATGLSPAKQVIMRPLRELNPSMGEGLERVVARATMPDPADRYQSCEEMRNDLLNHRKLTRAYRTGLKKRVGTFAGVCVLSVACAVSGAGCMARADRERTSTFGALMDSARSASTAADRGKKSEAEAVYTAAIEVEPGNAEAYRELIDGVYKADQRLTASEGTRLEALLEKNRSVLEGSDGYARLCYDVGSLYAVYRESASEDDGLLSLGAKEGARAQKWFERCVAACERGRDGDARLAAAAAAYGRICAAPQELARATLEGNEGDEYARYWAALADAYEALGDDSPLMVRLRLCDLIEQVCASPTYLSGFARAGVARARTEELAEKAREGLVGLEAEASANAVTAELWGRASDERLLDRIAENIERTYGAKAWRGEEA